MSVSAAPPAIRRIVVHHHLFKNAGTSIDRILERYFGEAWLKVEKKDTPGEPPIETFIARHPDMLAVSSHTAPIRPVELPGIATFPIVFVRHPLDRIPSVYLFTQRQKVDAWGPNLAKRADLKGFVEAYLERPRDHSIRDFQTRRLAAYVDGPGSYLSRALAAVAALPFVGLVEQFAQSGARLETAIRAFGYPTFRVFEVRANRSARPLDLAERLHELEQTLGRETWDRLVAANGDDLALHRHVTEHFTPGKSGAAEAAPG